MVDVINPGITAGIGQQQNPMQLLGQFANAQNALNQNALFQQTFRARQAMGPLMQQATNPQTGEVDWDKAATLVATHPETSFMAPEFLNNIAQKKLLDAETTNQKLNATEKRLAIWSSGAAGASKTLTGEPGHDLTTFVSDMMSAGGIDPAEMKKQIPWLAQLQGKPVSEQKAHLAQMAMVTDQGRQALSQINGSYSPNMFRDNQGNEYPGWASSVMGQIRPAGLPASQGFPGAQPAAAGAPGGAQGAETPNAPRLTPGTAGPQQDWINKTYYPQLQEAAQSSQALLNTIGEGKQLLANAAAGRASPTRLEVARWLTSAGISYDQATKIAGGDPTNSQALQKLILYIGTQGMRTANQGNAAVRSVQEWSKFMEANPNLANDKGAITKMWDFMSYQASLITQEQQEFNRQSGMGMDTTQFPAKWNNFVNDQTQQYFKSRSKWYGGQ